MMEHSPKRLFCGGLGPVEGSVSCVCSLATARVGPRPSLAFPAPGTSCSGCRVLDTGAAAGPQAVMKGLSLRLGEKGARSPDLSHAHTPHSQFLN